MPALSDTSHLPLAEHVQTDVAPEPVFNILNTLALLTRIEELPALDDWPKQAAAALTGEQKETNRLLFEALAPAFLLDGDWPDFPTYLDQLESTTGEELRDRMLQPLCRPDRSAGPSDLRPCEPDELLADPHLYLSRVERRFPGRRLDAALHAAAHVLLNEPRKLHAMIVGHIRMMWEEQLRGDWERHARELQNQVNVLHRRQAERPKFFDDLHALIGPDVTPNITVQMAGVRQVIFVPSAHTARYATSLSTGSTLRVFFSATRSFAAGMRSVRVGRQELLNRLGALADDTRLSILELFAEQDALSAQDIMTRLNLTQSTVSRQLRALAPYVGEMRRNTGKIYRFSPSQINLTFHTLKQLLAGEEPRDEEPDEREGQPGDLRRFMNRQGLIAVFPARPADKQLVLEYLAARFEPGRQYTEQEVNDLLLRHIAFSDYVTLRRYLCDLRMLERTRDGSRYWRTQIGS